MTTRYALAKVEDHHNAILRGTGRRMCYHVDRTTTFQRGVVAGSVNTGFYHSTCDYCEAWAGDYYNSDPPIEPTIYTARDW